MFAKSMIYQPYLFEIPDFISEPADSELAGKRLVSKINKFRKSLTASEKEYDFYLARTVREIRSVSSLSDDKQKELVLKCLETCCHTWGEIEEDSHLSQEKVREILIELQKNDLILVRKRLVIGGSARQVLIYSKRKPCPCV